MSRQLLLIVMTAAAMTAAPDKKLVVERAALAQSEDGTPVPKDFQFVPGEVVFFSCQVSGYAKRPKEDDQIVDLVYQIDAADSKGVPIIPSETGRVASTLTAEDKEWLPKIRHSIALPALADTGEYQVTIKVKDNLGGGETQATVPLLVQGGELAPSDTLIVRNFRFLRTEEDKDPLNIAAYRPGDAVWARFDITGYKLGEGNRYDVAYGLKVLKPDGETTFEQAQAAEEKNQSYYPQRHTPGVLSLSLPKDIKRGEYTIVLQVRDNVGQQRYETREKFAVD